MNHKIKIAVTDKDSKFYKNNGYTFAYVAQEGEIGFDAFCFQKRLKGVNRWWYIFAMKNGSAHLDGGNWHMTYKTVTLRGKMSRAISKRKQQFKSIK